MPFLGTTDQDKNIKGFSLVEILIVIVIFSILLTMAGSMFRAYENNRYLKEAAAALMSDIKLAKQRSVSEYVERVDNVDYPVVYRITIAPSKTIHQYNDMPVVTCRIIATAYRHTPLRKTMIDK